jgi:O-antigen/teichoic acid export membrane protein
MNPTNAADQAVPSSPSWGRTRQVAFSIVDQGFSVGGMFLVNIALARGQTKDEYGIFALSYSVFTFLAGMHNAAILEAYTIYGSGRYRERFSGYAWLLWRSNLLLAAALTALLTVSWGVLYRTAPKLASHTVLGLALTCGVLLTASFARRTFYIRHRPDLAARFSAGYFAVCAGLLWLSLRLGILSGFSAFVIAAVSWAVSGIFVARNLPHKPSVAGFLQHAPNYWAEHWKYSRWVFVTALVFQFTTQAYYWLAAGYLSVKEVADLRAMYNLVTPVEQVFVAVALLILPMMSRQFSEKHLAGLMPLWKSYCFATVLITGGFALLVNLAGKPAMHLIYAGRFDDVASLVGLLALFPLVMGVGNTMNAALKALEKPQAVFYAYVTSGVATFVIGIPLVLHWGLRGTVYGMLASAATYSFALTIAFFSSVRGYSNQSALVGAAKQATLSESTAKI